MSSEGFGRKMKILGLIPPFLLALAGEPSYGQSRPPGRPATQADIEAMLGPEEVARRAQYERQASRDPAIVRMEQATAQRIQEAREWCARTFLPSVDRQIARGDTTIDYQTLSECDGDTPERMRRINALGR